jgi:septal ring factor EnvC (AmiA/AmiB activator)
MDLLQVVGLLALVAGVAALALVLDARGRIARLEVALATAQQLNAELRSAHEAVHAEMTDVRTELQTTQRHLDRAQRELGELKAAAEVVPAPPLPKTRSGSNLDDLREQLRAAHREPDSADEA